MSSFIKYFALIFIIASLAGCFSNSKKEAAVIVDKSIEKSNLQDEAVKKAVKVASKISPVEAEVLEYFSKTHPGLTFNTHPGQQVIATSNGIVVYSGNKMKALGKIIIIKHPLGFYSTYAHNETLKVQNDNKVKKGQIIATTGADNFYFAMKKFETPINPLEYLK